MIAKPIKCLAVYNNTGQQLSVEGELPLPGPRGRTLVLRAGSGAQVFAPGVVGFAITDDGEALVFTQEDCDGAGT